MGKEITQLEPLDTGSNIEGFNWDSEVSGIDFFGEVVTKPEKTVESDDETDTKVKSEEKKPGEKIEETEEEIAARKSLESFEKGEEDDEDVAPGKKVTKTKGTEDDNETEVEVTQTKAVLSFLKNQKALELSEEEIEDLEGLEEEDRAEALTDYFEQAIEQRLEQSIKELPDSVKSIIKYASKGGNVETLIKKMFGADSAGLREDLDMDIETNQEMVVRKRLQEEEYDEDYINSQIEFLKDSKKLKAVAEKHFNKWKADKTESVNKELERIENARKAQRESQLNFKKDISKQVAEQSEYKGFKLTKKEASELPDYISTPSVELEDGRVITPFYKDFFNAIKDKEKLILMAKLLKSDFDFSQLKKEIDTERTSKLKEDLQRQKKTKSIQSSGGSSQQPRRLIDMLGD